ncbi:MAG TPA: LysE family translocator, partial [Chitinophagaceae bacterium]|nr:LysE family translocator [Chitinophagaceae bacterium]
MAGIINFETFLLAGILLNITPGNDTIFILTRSITQGKQAGIISVIGIATGSVVHTTFAAFGLSIIISESIVAFSILKYAGAAYLIFIGYQMLADPSNPELKIQNGERSVNLKKLYREAVITNLFNPKVALFFIAFLPQFIDPAFKNTLPPFMLLGITFTMTGTLWCLLLTNCASFVAAKIKSNNRVSSYINKTCGLVFIGLGIKLAL